MPRATFGLYHFHHPHYNHHLCRHHPHLPAEAKGVPWVELVFTVLVLRAVLGRSGLVRCSETQNHSSSCAHCTKYQAKLTPIGNTMLVFGFGFSSS